MYAISVADPDRLRLQDINLFIYFFVFNLVNFYSLYDVHHKLLDKERYIKKRKKLSENGLALIVLGYNTPNSIGREGGQDRSCLCFDLVNGQKFFLNYILN